MVSRIIRIYDPLKSWYQLKICYSKYLCRYKTITYNRKIQSKNLWKS